MTLFALRPGGATLTMRAPRAMRYLGRARARARVDEADEHAARHRGLAVCHMEGHLSSRHDRNMGSYGHYSISIICWRAPAPSGLGRRCSYANVRVCKVTLFSQQTVCASAPFVHPSIHPSIPVGAPSPPKMLGEASPKTPGNLDEGRTVMLPRLRYDPRFLFLWIIHIETGNAGAE